MQFRMDLNELAFYALSLERIDR
ncbi:protein of unknown function [Rhodovastum atsumiense]|nr:protein of unknown function [Rhodovastum atsumiense]